MKIFYRFEMTPEIAFCPFSSLAIIERRISYPINEITIAGNLSEMFNNITLANDLEFSYATNSPTLMIEGMVVAGK